MTDNLPNYATMEPPADKSPEEYSHHERRAELLQVMEHAGGPYAVNLAQLAGRYDVHRSTLSRDRQRLKEAINDRLGDEAELEKWVLYRHVVSDLLEADDWRATKAAWDVRDDYDDWLANIGEQHREPDRVEADVRQRTSEVQYRVVREEPDDVPVDGENGSVDYAALGFTAAPGGEVDVEAVDAIEDEEVSEADE